MVVVRGLAVLFAAGAVFVLATRWTPGLRPPRPDLPALWVLPAALLAGVGFGLVAFGFLGVPAGTVAGGVRAAATPVSGDLVRRRRHVVHYDTLPIARDR